MSINQLKDQGFVNFPYPQNLRQAVETAEASWRAFCELSLEEKKVFAYSNAGAGVGYEVKDGSGNKGDKKENFDVARAELPALEARLQSDVLSYTAALVARKFVYDAVALVEIMTPFIVDFASEAESVFQLSNFEEEISGGSGAFFVRFIHYFPQGEAGDEIAQPHPDQSGFTLHLFESEPGLQMLTFGNEWVPMSVSEGETVIIPDMQMQLRSEGELKAVWHRVVSTERSAAEGRFSAVCFIQFKDTPKYDKDSHGRLQEKPQGFNYEMGHEEFKKLFR